MYCIHCGNQLPDDAKFCYKCGQPTTPVEFDPFVNDSEEIPRADKTVEIPFITPEQVAFQGNQARAEVQPDVVAPHPPQDEPIVSTPEYAFEQARKAQREKTIKRSSNSMFIIILISVVLVIFIGLGIYALSNLGGSSPDTPTPAPVETISESVEESVSESTPESTPEETDTTEESTTESVTESVTESTTEPSDGDYILPTSATSEISNSDLEGLDTAELQMAINEIYARHGREFVTENTQNYFDAQDWYTPSVAAEEFDASTNDYLSYTEQTNIATIQKYIAALDN